MVVFLTIYGVIVIHLIIGIFVWEKIDIKTRFQNKNDEYLQPPIIIGGLFSFFFIKKIKEKRKINVIKSLLNDMEIRMLFIGYEKLDESEKNILLHYNRILKITKIKNKK